MLFTIGVIVVIVAHVCTILTIVELFDLQASDVWEVMVNFETFSKKGEELGWIIICETDYPVSNNGNIIVSSKLNSTNLYSGIWM